MCCDSVLTSAVYSHTDPLASQHRNKQIQSIMSPTDVSAAEKLLPQTFNSEQIQKTFSCVTPWSLIRVKDVPPEESSCGVSRIRQRLLAVHQALCVTADDVPFPLNWHTHISLISPSLSHQCMRNYLMRNGSHISTNSLTHERVRLIAAFG